MGRMAGRFLVVRNPDADSSLPYRFVVEDRYKLERVAPGFVPDLRTRVQVRWPSVPIVLCETRPLAEQWSYRFLGAALSEMVGARDNGMTVSRPGGRGPGSTGSRKVGAPQGRVLASGQSGRPAGKCHREQTADGSQSTGKGETVR